MDIKNFFDNLSNEGFPYLIELYFSFISMIREFIFSDPKIAVSVVLFLIVGSIYSFVKRIIPLLVVGGILMVIIFSPELVNKIPFLSKLF